MIKFLSLSLVLAFSASVFAQNKESRDCQAFSGVEVSKGANLTLLQDKSKSGLEIVCDGCPTSDVETVVKNGILSVKMKKRTAGSAVQVTVYFSDINSIEVKRGASIETATGCQFSHKGKLTLGVGAQSEVELDIDVDELEVDANTCLIKLDGRADVQNVTIAGTVGQSTYDASGLKSRTVKIRATETDAHVAFSEKLDAEAVHCTIKYDGDDSNVTKSEKLGGEVVAE